METVWSGPLTRRVRGPVFHRSFTGQDAIQLARGEEMGRFNMGSTVIVLFGPDAVTLAPTIQAGATVSMGQCLASHGS